MEKVIVIKIGGSTLGSNDTTIEDVVALQKRGEGIMVVHGGGKIITEWLAKQNVPAKFIKGERVTDKQTLDVAIAVLTGLVNKELVAAINMLGGNAVGISGVDGKTVLGQIKNTELGYVGKISGIDITLLKMLLHSGFIPVISTIALNTQDKENGVNILNVNADTVAGEIAVASDARKLIFLTDVDGIHDTSGKVIMNLNSGEAEALISSGVASGGMIPKIKACLRAASHNAATCIIDGRQPHVLLDYVDGKESGTVIKNKQ
jgi:acetylglutamate kinase